MGLNTLQTNLMLDIQQVLKKYSISGITALYTINGHAGNFYLTEPDIDRESHAVIMATDAELDRLVNTLCGGDLLFSETGIIPDSGKP